MFLYYALYLVRLIFMNDFEDVFSFLIFPIYSCRCIIESRLLTHFKEVWIFSPPASCFCLDYLQILSIPNLFPLRKKSLKKGLFLSFSQREGIISPSFSFLIKHLLYISTVLIPGQQESGGSMLLHSELK